MNPWTGWSLCHFIQEISSTKEFSQKVAAKNPEEKHQKMDSGSTKTKIQGDESKDVKPPAFGHDMTKMEKRSKNTGQQTHHHRKNRATRKTI